MKKQNFKQRSGILFIGVFLLVGITFNACKKVDNKYGEIINRPWVGTGGEFSYPSSVLVGDTVTLVGKIFLDKGGYIQVGSIKPALSGKTIIPTGNGENIPLDQVKFIITKEMGVGNVPVELVANGITIKLPNINIRQYAGTPHSTDTTLFVDQIAVFQPGNLGSYQANNYNVLNNASIDADGNIWFDNPLGVFKVNGATIQNVLNSGSVLNDASGAFTINNILGSVISYDGNTLSFSAAVTDNANSVNNYVFKLCRLNLNTNAVTTLNTTLVSKTIPASPALPGKFEGPADQLHIVAMFLRTDVNNVLYFNNSYFVPVASIASYGSYYLSYWYSSVTSGNTINGAAVDNNICKLGADGKVISLFSYHDPYPANGPDFNAPGFHLVVTWDYKISRDGSFAYVYNEVDASGSQFGLLQFDLQKRLPLHSVSPGASFKYLPSVPSGFGSPSVNFTFNYPNGDFAMLPLPDGTILQASGNSIAALNILDQTQYLYAGTFTGLFGSAGPLQTQKTGQAKNVLFNNNYYFGVDKHGAVYYLSPGYYGSLSTPPMTFYKLYSKKG